MDNPFKVLVGGMIAGGGCFAAIWLFANGMTFIFKMVLMVLGIPDV